MGEARNKAPQCTTATDTGLQWPKDHIYKKTIRDFKRNEDKKKRKKEDKDNVNIVKGLGNL